MSQISPPIRIVLVVAVAFLAAYMLFLRPKDEVVPPAEPAPNVQTGAPAETAPGAAVEAAQGAVDAANGQLQAQESVDGADAGEAGAAQAAGTLAADETAPKGSAAAAGTIPADLKGVPAPVKKAIKDGKVLTLLFWNRKSADDQAVRAALRDVNTWGGRVHVHTANIQGISKWGRISRGVSVEQSPTVVVVDPELRAETLVGYVDAKTIDQAVADALRNTTGLFESRKYFAEINAVCAKYAGPIFAVPGMDAGDPKSWRAAALELQTKWNALRADFRAVPAPKRLRTFKAAALRDANAHSALMAEWIAFVGTKPTIAKVATAQRRYPAREHRLLRSWDRRMDKRDVVSCGTSM